MARKASTDDEWMRNAMINAGHPTPGCLLMDGSRPFRERHLLSGMSLPCPSRPVLWERMMEKGRVRNGQDMLFGRVRGRCQGSDDRGRGPVVGPHPRFLCLSHRRTPGADGHRPSGGFRGLGDEGRLGRMITRPRPASARPRGRPRCRPEGRSWRSPPRGPRTSWLSRWPSFPTWASRGG